jgi:hypothetical protein
VCSTGRVSNVRGLKQSSTASRLMLPYKIS